VAGPAAAVLRFGGGTVGVWPEDWFYVREST
jgi:hypothetical protein